MKFVVFLVAALAVAASAAPTEKPHKAHPTPVAPHKSNNFRNEFDQVLFAFAEEHLIRAEHALFRTQMEVNEFKEHHDAHLKTKAILLIQHENDMLQETLAHLDTQKARKDFNDLEMYLLEKMHNDCALLIKHFNHLKAALH